MLKKVVLKDETITKCLEVSPHVLTLKHYIEQQLLTQRRLFQPLQKTKSNFLLISQVNIRVDLGGG